MTMKFLPLGAVLVGLAAQAQATGTSPAEVTPYVLSDTTYTQSFNSLASTGGQVERTLPQGWQVHEVGTGTSYVNSNANGFYYAGSTTGQAGAIGAVSYGRTSSDRALGGRASADVPQVYFGSIFQNDLGGVIDSLSLSYTGEQWVNGFSRATLNFEYSLDATSLTSGTWTSFSGLDFLAPNNDPQGASTVDRIRATSVDGNTSAFSQQLTGVIDGLAIANGANFGFRWSLDYISAPHSIGGVEYNVSSNDGLAIDNVRLSAMVAPAPVPEPATWAMMIAGLGLVGGALRTSRAKAALA